MTGLADPAAGFAERLERVRQRLARHADAPSPPAALTEEDPATGERWDRGQVWAHLAEFPSYWMREVRLVAEGGAREPVPFGRVKSDPQRIASIESDRRRPVQELAAMLASQLEELAHLLRGVPAEAWGAGGVHQTLGTMALHEIVDEFLVGHLEEHAEQLDSLAETP